jgi:hypothetical protein
MHALKLEVPDEIYEPLLTRAKQNGQTPEQLALNWLAAAVQQPGEDPLLQLAGAFECERTDVSECHDVYLGQGLAKELQDSSDG